MSTADVLESQQRNATTWATCWTWGAATGSCCGALRRTSTRAVGIEPDAKTIARARTRLHDAENVSLQCTRFASFDPGAARVDLITLVATLHHMDLQPALERAAALLRSGGQLLVVGLTANHTPIDWILSAAALPLARIGSLLHRETDDIGVPTPEPRENLAVIRQVSRKVLPGRKIRRGLYYRYLLTWEKPKETTGSATNTCDEIASDAIHHRPSLIADRVWEKIWRWESARHRHLAEHGLGALRLTLTWRRRWGCVGSS